MTVRAVLAGREYALGPLTESLGFLTRAVNVQINERVRASGGLGVSPAIFSTLQLLQVNPGIRQVDAARLLVIQESNMANLVKDLVARGLVERRGETPKRVGLWITAAGESELARCATDLAADRIYGGVLSDAEYGQLLQLLNRVYRAALA